VAQGLLGHLGAWHHRTQQGADRVVRHHLLRCRAPARWLGQDLLPDYARLCGFGAKTGIEIEEETGLVPDGAWKMETKGEGWSPGDTVNLAIGQGELKVTPLQAARLYAAIGNGGTLYSPRSSR